MISVEAHKPSQNTRLQLQESDGGTVICLDFQGIAGLIDTVAGAAPERLTSLLEALWGSDVKSETKFVAGLAAACRDPLAVIDHCCRDAVKTAIDLHKLAMARGWQSPAEVCIQPRAIALLNLCDAHLQDRLRSSGRKRRRYTDIRPRLAAAAEQESQRRAWEIKLLAINRQASHRDLRNLYASYTARP